MKVNRSKFIQHLNRLACAGQCTEVVFTDAFAATALTPDQLLLIDIPAMDGAEPLEKEIGVANLDRFIKSLKLLPGEGNTGVEVDIYVKDNRLVIDDGSRGVQKLLTAAPKTIATRIEGTTADNLFKAVPQGGKVNLSRSVLEGVCSAFSLYKAEEIEIKIGRIGGKILVGTEKTDRAEFDLDVTSEEEYTLLFGKHLVDVFSIITDFSSAALQLGGGSKKPILVIDGDYTYMLSPRARSADESKPPMKESKAEKTTEAAAETTAPQKKNRGRRAAASE